MRKLDTREYTYVYIWLYSGSMGVHNLINIHIRFVTFKNKLNSSDTYTISKIIGILGTFNHKFKPTWHKIKF